MSDQTRISSARFELGKLLEAGAISYESAETLRDLCTDRLGYGPPAGWGRIDQEIPENIVPIAPLPSFEGVFRVALCLGHARDGDAGAYALNGVSEEVFNLPRLRKVAKLLRGHGIEVVTLEQYHGKSYGKAMRWVAEELLRLDVHLAVEFHFNAAGPHAEGFEMLHWHKSTRGILAARAMQETQARRYPESYDRGVEPLGDQAHERGVLFTSLTHCPAVISEAFFGTNNIEVSRYMTADGAVDRLAECDAAGILAGILALKNAAGVAA